METLASRPFERREVFLGRLDFANQSRQGALHARGSVLEAISPAITPGLWDRNLPGEFPGTNPAIISAHSQ
jgi:hypothetical protein